MGTGGSVGNNWYCRWDGGALTSEMPTLCHRRDFGQGYWYWRYFCTTFSCEAKSDRLFPLGLVMVVMVFVSLWFHVLEWNLKLAGLNRRGVCMLVRRAILPSSDLYMVEVWTCELISEFISASLPRHTDQTHTHFVELFSGETLASEETLRMYCLSR